MKCGEAKMSRHHHRDRDRCGERYEHREHCRDGMYMAFPIGSMPGTESDSSYGMPENPLNSRQGSGGSCYMTPGGRVCPGTGAGGSSCYMTPTGPVCPGSGEGSCYMTPNGMVCPMPEAGGSGRMTPRGPGCSMPGYGLR
jgi:hypothetical protein